VLRVLLLALPPVCSSVPSHQLSRDASTARATGTGNNELYNITTAASTPAVLVLRLLSPRCSRCTKTEKAKGREGSVLFEEPEFTCHAISITSGRWQAREALLAENDRRAVPLAGEVKSMYEHQQHLTSTLNRPNRRTDRSLCYTMGRRTPTGISIRVSSLGSSVALTKPTGLLEQDTLSTRSPRTSSTAPSWSKATESSGLARALLLLLALTFGTEPATFLDTIRTAYH
jgi:hypothetical protein